MCVNELEAEALTKIRFNEIKDGASMIAHFREKGCKTIIITLGKHGVVYNDEEKCGKIFHVPIPSSLRDISVIDSTGMLIKSLNIIYNVYRCKLELALNLVSVTF